MAEHQVDHLAMAGEAARLNDLAVRRSGQGRRVEALAAAEESRRLYQALVEPFPTMFGADAERADALAAAIRENRPPPSTAGPAAAGPREPADETTAADVRASGTAGVPDRRGAVTTPEPAGPEPPRPSEPPTASAPTAPAEPPAPTTRRPHRSRRRTVTSVVTVAATVAVVLGTLGAVGWAVTRQPPPAPEPVRAPPAAAPAPAREWIATVRIGVAPPGVALRSTPSTAGTPVGRLPAGAGIRIQCGVIGRMTSSDSGERSSSWLRTTTGSYLAAVNVDVSGPGPLPNCTSGQPPVPLPHSS